ncbi:MAG: flagellar hook-associated protein FlgK [Alphaproteobacteria bacterium]|nr:flagellar hook-associated protein FlgK [Alphaproteobacteria bacterium]
MSLISSLHTSFAGLRNTESNMNVISSNVTNADKAGYTRKTYETEYTTTSSGTSPSGGTSVTANYDQYLFKTVVSDATEAGYYETTSDYLSQYVDAFGSNTDTTTLSSAMSDFDASLSALGVTPDDESLKAQVVQDAETLSYQLRDVSSSIQNLRAQADEGIALAVDSVNQSLQTIETLNKKITVAEALGQSTADFEDERRAALENIASYMDVDYFIDGDNKMNIYVSGLPLLDSTAHYLSYTTAGTVTDDTVYPGGFSALSLNGVDITNKLTGGALGALIEMRDTTLPGEQDKLDELAVTLMEQMNSLLNEGTSLPPRSEMIGDVEGLGGGSSLSGASGTIRIATVDDSGTIINAAVIDLSTTATMSDLLTAINTALGPDVTASLTSDGALQITANNSGEGIAISQMDSALGSPAQNFSDYFGLNGLFTGTGASDIFVSDYLRENSDYLATSSLSDTAAIGSAGVNPGDGTIASDMAEVFSASVSFSAAGDFAATSTSLQNYADRIIATAANAADAAVVQADSVSSIYSSTKSALENMSGVNVDEEMSRMVEFESKYQASATLISVLQDMFDELITAVR